MKASVSFTFQLYVIDPRRESDLVLMKKSVLAGKICRINEMLFSSLMRWVCFFRKADWTKQWEQTSFRRLKIELIFRWKNHWPKIRFKKSLCLTLKYTHKRAHTYIKWGRGRVKAREEWELERANNVHIIFTDSFKKKKQPLKRT